MASAEAVGGRRGLVLAVGARRRGREVGERNADIVGIVFEEWWRRFLS